MSTQMLLWRIKVSWTLPLCCKKPCIWIWIVLSVRRGTRKEIKLLNINFLSACVKFIAKAIAIGNRSPIFISSCVTIWCINVLNHSLFCTTLLLPIMILFRYFWYVLIITFIFGWRSNFIRNVQLLYDTCNVISMLFVH